MDLSRLNTFVKAPCVVNVAMESKIAKAHSCFVELQRCNSYTNYKPHTSEITCFLLQIIAICHPPTMQRHPSMPWLLPQPSFAPMPPVLSTPRDRDQVSSLALLIMMYSVLPCAICRCKCEGCHVYSLQAKYHSPRSPRPSVVTRHFRARWTSTTRTTI